MTDPLGGELDRLFRLPPGEMVEARNALADQLKRAGDKAGAARIKAIKRAVPVAWAINQVWFEEPELLERAREVTGELRALHAQGVEAKRLAGAVEQQRVVMQAVVDAALRAGRNAGLSENALQRRKLFTTVQAWLAGKGEEPPGRMTQELEASGFDAFAGMTLPAVLPAPLAPLSDAAPAAPNDAPSTAHLASESTERAALEQAERLVAEHDRRVAGAAEQLHKRQTEHAAAQLSRDQAQTSVREAERQLTELRAMFDERTRELERRATALHDARVQHERADAAAAAARLELAALSAKR
jgi:hypothetical protein